MTDPPLMQPVDPLPPNHSRGALLLGVLIGVVYLAGYVALNMSAPFAESTFRGALLIAPVVVLLVAAIVLTSIPRTRSLGTGLMISMGIALLGGAGLCFALVGGLNG